LWLRRALFQVHMWTGLALGLYLIVVSVSGSALVFRSELSLLFDREPVPVEITGARLTADELRTAAEGAYPGFRASQVWETDDPQRPVEVWLERDGRRRQRLFDPYTGQDVGHAIPAGIRLISWLLDLHDNLLGGDTGRAVNGVA